MTDPTTGGGIHQALWSGIAAARAVKADRPSLYERELRPVIRESRWRYAMKQVLFAMDRDEMVGLFDGFASFPIPGGPFSPYDIRADLVRHLRRTGFRPLRILLRGRRFWRAVMG